MAEIFIELKRKDRIHGKESLWKNEFVILDVKINLKGKAVKLKSFWWNLELKGYYLMV